MHEKHWEKAANIVKKTQINTQNLTKPADTHFFMTKKNNEKEEKQTETRNKKK